MEAGRPGEEEGRAQRPRAAPPVESRERRSGGKGSLQEVSFPRVKGKTSATPLLHTPLPPSLSLVSLTLSPLSLSLVSHGLPPPTKRQPTRAGGRERGEEREKRVARVPPSPSPAFAPIAAPPRARSAPRAPPPRCCCRDRGVVSGIGFHGELLIWIPDPIGAG